MGKMTFADLRYMFCARIRDAQALLNLRGCSAEERVEALIAVVRAVAEDGYKKGIFTCQIGDDLIAEITEELSKAVDAGRPDSEIESDLAAFLDRLWLGDVVTAVSDVDRTAPADAQ